MYDYGYIIVGSERRDMDFSEEDREKYVLREIDLGNNRTIYDERDRLPYARDWSLFYISACDCSMVRTKNITGTAGEKCLSDE